MKHVGKNTYRLKDNPAEKAFAKAWEESNQSGHTLEYLLSTVVNKRETNTERDVLVAATVIQWLGSPCGMWFIVDAANHCDELRKYMLNNLKGAKK